MLLLRNAFTGNLDSFRTFHENHLHEYLMLNLTTRFWLQVPSCSLETPNGSNTIAIYFILGQHILFEKKTDRVFVSALTLICVIHLASLFPRSRKSQASKPRCIQATEVARCLSINKSMCLVLLALGQK